MLIACCLEKEDWELVSFLMLHNLIICQEQLKKKRLHSARDITLVLHHNDIRMMLVITGLNNDNDSCLVIVVIEVMEVILVTVL